ncbi:MAG: 30S ribosomal protein S2 [Candidatus Woesebacteria bacterium GW2011_GWC1_43_10b]|uniref:Small ribosomal subunit protein uS2 n=1 Tax=Candidatus Woesebacteria bacterium GW2011_GWC1_43_10b TaxID=1618585 RepID=A0A0G1F1R9_9BACT|nr:MAG: 30S ribosomal protein S2 [Candidatus Woesebacteria bacterium GW2011_GWC1_43_10b]
MTKINISLEELLEAGAHFGHHSRRWNPKMEPYLHGVKDGVHIFDLVKTREALLAALEVLRKASSEGKVILFVGAKKQAKEKVREVAKNVGQPYVVERWLGGTLTNFDQILKSIKNMADMKKKLEEGYYKDYTKKEKLLIKRQIEKDEKVFGGISEIKKVPDVMVVIDTHREAGAVKEASKLGIETIGVVDSNSDPYVVDWPIPMNDDGTRALELILDLLEKAILAGKKKGKK